MVLNLHVCIQGIELLSFDSILRECWILEAPQGSHDSSFSPAEEPPEEPRNNFNADVVILSYPQYCRYRCILRRLESCPNQWLKNAVISAIGGFTVQNPRARVMFCRNTMDHPLLEDHSFRLDHLGWCLVPVSTPVDLYVWLSLDSLLLFTVSVSFPLCFCWFNIVSRMS